MIVPKWFLKPRVVNVTSIVVFAILVIWLAHWVRSTSRVPPGPGIRMMVVGDSISHGWEGDYTWRYRLWDWFRYQGVAVDFVGPYHGTMIPLDDVRRKLEPPVSPGQAVPEPVAGTEGGYAKDISPDFTRNHFAVWGRQIENDLEKVAEHVNTYNPEYMLIELGYNDLLWWWGVEDTIANMKKLVDKARSSKSDLKFAISDIPSTSMGVANDVLQKGEEYSAWLSTIVANWSTVESPIAHVKLRENYSCGPGACPSGRDGLHPNILGEFQIARAFAQALHDDFGLCRRPLTIPKVLPQRRCEAPQRPRAIADRQGINVTWEPVYGAYGYQMQARTKGTKWPSNEWNFGSTTAHYETDWTADGRRWEFRTRVECGSDKWSKWSRGSQAIAAGSVPASHVSS